MKQTAEFLEERKSKFLLTNRSCWLLLTIPINVAKDEHTFSRLKIVETRLQIMMRDKRLEPLLLLSCEKDITDSIDVDVITKDWETLK